MKCHFLGDVHGCWSVIDQALKRYRDHRIFQVGDMGLGFPRSYTYMDINDGKTKTKTGPPDPLAFPAHFRFVRGNHDEPGACRRHPNYLGDYGQDPQTGLFFVSGAESHDQQLRTPDLDWWAGEQLSMPELQAAIDLYAQLKPDCVISHEPPLAAQHALSKRGWDDRGSRTVQALQALLDIHPPRLWVFGHWHCVWRKQMGRTLFACAATNQILTFDIDAPVHANTPAQAPVGQLHGGRMADDGLAAGAH